MTISTAFNIGDIVYIMEDNVISNKKYIIYQIITTSDLDSNTNAFTEYKVRTTDEISVQIGSYNEYQIFKNKEDAIELWVLNQGFNINGKLTPV